MENKGKILVVDDEQGIRDMLSYELGLQGFDVVTAKDGHSAIDKIKEKEFDLAIIDIKMPGMDGVTTLGEIKKISPGTEAIMATGYGTMDTAIESMRKGASNYINKPFNIENMSVVVNKAIEKRRLKESIALYEISKAIFSTIKIDELLKVIINSTIKVLKSDNAFLMLFDDAGKLYVGSSFVLYENINENTMLAISERIAGSINENTKPFLLTHGLKKDTRFSNIEGIERINSSTIIPLKGEEKFLGFLIINRTTTNENFNATDLYKANIFSSLVSMAVDNANLYKELQTTQEQLFHIERIASLGRLAGGVAHEINNPLTSVLSTAELILEDIGNISEASEFKVDIEQIIEEAKRIKDTVKDFLGFARTRNFVFEEYDINRILDNALGIVGRAILENFDVIKSYDSLPEVKISRFHLEEVFVNLITNALHSMEKKGTLSIKTFQEGEFIIVTIKDTGKGIEKENLKKIFEPYFTTKRQKGTGLGLSTSIVTVSKHGGKIEVASEGIGKGSEFKVYLPLQTDNGQ